MPSVSIIIPVYNTARYLEECILSVTRQDCRDWEIILVDDGSTDESPELCDLYATEDSRIHVIHQTNQGLSMARNNGLTEASGEYVLFLDSDDFWLYPDTLSRLLSACETHPECDFVGFNWVYYYEEKEQKKWVDFGDYIKGIADGETALRQILTTGSTPMSACTKIIRRAFLLERGISFIPDITSEDIPWFTDLLCATTHCLFLHDYLYAYRQEVDGSITKHYSRKRLEDLTFIIEEGVEKAVEQPEGMRDALYAFYATEYCILLSHLDLLSLGELEEKQDWLDRYEFLLRYDLSPKVRLARRVHQLLGRGTLAKMLRLRNRLKH